MDYTKTEKIAHLIIGDLSGFLNETEREELQAWLKQSPEHRAVYEKILSDRHLRKRLIRYQQIDPARAYRDFKKRIRQTNRIRLRSYLKYAAFLFVLLAITGITTYILLTYQGNTGILESNRTQQAILILDDGTNITLNQSASTSRLLQTSVSANETDSGIVYGQKPADGQLRYNTLVTPRGGEYTVILSDGTKVHLNSSSELKYPVVFSPSNREVFLKGEAYFTVSQDKERPFIVHTEDLKIRQYGTSFNINSYDPETVRVVLVKGSIGISIPESEKEQLVEPAQLAEFHKKENKLTIKDVDIASYVSWHEGQLVFDDMPLHDIAVTLSNWYDVDIIISDPQLQNLHFTGSVNRSEPVKDILDAIQQAVEVKIAIKDQSIYISKQ